MSGADSPAEAADEVHEAEEAEQRALEEEERLRLKVLAELQTSGTVFRSAPEDVLDYAVLLGMKLDEDKELLWIADQALQSQDPEGWSQCESPNGDLYYVNDVTKQVLWQHPLDYQYQQMYLEEKQATLPSRLASPHTRCTCTHVVTAATCARCACRSLLRRGRKHYGKSKLPSGPRYSRGWPRCPSTCGWA